MKKNKRERNSESISLSKEELEKEKNDKSLLPEELIEKFDFLKSPHKKDKKVMEDKNGKEPVKE